MSDTMSVGNVVCSLFTGNPDALTFFYIMEILCAKVMDHLKLVYAFWKENVSRS